MALKKTFEAKLEEEGVMVEKCSFNASVWQIAQMMNEAGFERFAKKIGMVTHYDKPDITLDEKTKKAYMDVDKELMDEDFKPVPGRQGQYTLDLEVYIMSAGALTYAVTAEGE
ncbi:MAG: hypothetical protein PHQ80_03490 [Candidatus ainarchaeum sp.]|nr:hypothetical protein [Candidatus ainarchaeum sp.]